MKLGEHDEIICAFAERASGPGWGNQPIWCVVRSRLDGAMRMVAIPPQGQTAEMMTLYRISEVAHGAMTSAVKSHFATSPKRKLRSAGRVAAE